MSCKIGLPMPFPLQTTLSNTSAPPRRAAPTLSHHSVLSQFMTPPGVARFIASLFPKADKSTCHLLDAGVRMGALSAVIHDSKRDWLILVEAVTRYVSEIAWETEVWAVDAPTHLIHFNGSRFLGPYQ